MDENDRISLEMGRAAFGITHTQPTDHAAQLAARDAEIEHLKQKLVNQQAETEAWVAENTKHAATIARLREALTPSLATKIAYTDEFKIRVTFFNEEGGEYHQLISIPWITIKEIMAAILNRAALKEDTNG